MALLTVNRTTTVSELKEEFNQAFGATLRVYNGGRVADDNITLSELGLTNDGSLECRAILTVDSFIERMQKEHGLKVKVYTCDGWVAALGGLTLESAGKVKKNAVKADMESMIAYQRNDTAPKDTYSIVKNPDGSYTVSINGEVQDNAKAAMRRIAEAIGFEIDDKWNTQQVGAKLVKFLSETAFEHIERPKTEKSNIEKKHIASQVKVSKAVIARTRAQKTVDPIECQMVIIPSGCYRQIFRVYLGEKLVYPNGDRRRKQELQNIYEDRSRYVTISHAYSICKYPVTQRQWKMVMGEDNNPSKYRGDDLPITGIMYDDIMVFIKKLNILTGLHYRLPTYAESYWAAIGADKSNGSIIDARYHSDTPIDQLKLSNPKGLYYYCAEEFCGEFWESEKEWIDGLAVIDPSGPKEVKPIISEQPTNSYDKRHIIIPPTEGFRIVTFDYHTIDIWKRGWILDNVIDHLSSDGTMFRLVRIIE